MSSAVVVRRNGNMHSLRKFRERLAGYQISETHAYLYIAAMAIVIVVCVVLRLF